MLKADKAPPVQEKEKAQRRPFRHGKAARKHRQRGPGSGGGSGRSTVRGSPRFSIDTDTLRELLLRLDRDIVRDLLLSALAPERQEHCAQLSSVDWPRLQHYRLEAAHRKPEPLPAPAPPSLDPPPNGLPYPPQPNLQCFLEDTLRYFALLGPPCDFLRPQPSASSPACVDRLGTRTERNRIERKRIERVRRRRDERKRRARDIANRICKASEERLVSNGFKRNILKLEYLEKLCNDTLLDDRDITNKVLETLELYKGASCKVQHHVEAVLQNLNTFNDGMSELWVALIVDTVADSVNDLYAAMKAESKGSSVSGPLEDGTSDLFAANSAAKASRLWAPLKRAATSAHQCPLAPGFHLQQYSASLETRYLPSIRELISKDLSEPYSIYVYRYFLYQWGELCFMVLDEKEEMVGVVVSKLEEHRGGPLRGYIAMLAVKEEHRGKGLATKLVAMSIDEMIKRDADEVALETEVSNTTSLKLYERLGFLRSKKLHRYYLNGNSAYRLLLYLKQGTAAKPTYPPDFPPPHQDDEDSPEDYMPQHTPVATIEPAPLKQYLRSKPDASIT